MDPTCPHPSCFAQLVASANLPVGFFVCDQDGVYLTGIGNILYEMHPNFVGMSCWEAHENDPEGTEYYRRVLQDKQRQVFNIQHAGRVFSVVIDPLPNGGAQGVAVLALDRGSIAKSLAQGNIHEALAKNEFELWLQPIARLDTRFVVGYEALLRWRVGDHIIMPDMFLPQANGLMPNICLRVLELACSILHDWQTDPTNNYWLSINVAPSSISESFVERFKAICDDNIVPRNRLHLEITESGVGDQNISWFCSVMGRRGHRLKIDDYGSEAAGDIRITTLPIHDVKFDKIWIDSVIGKQNRVNEAQAIAFQNRLRLCQKLGIEVLVEGIETEFQRDWLVSQGVLYGQGWLFGKPEPPKKNSRLFSAAAVEERETEREHCISLDSFG